MGVFRFTRYFFLCVGIKTTDKWHKNNEIPSNAINVFVFLILKLKAIKMLKSSPNMQLWTVLEWQILLKILNWLYQLTFRIDSKRQFVMNDLMRSTTVVDRTRIRRESGRRILFYVKYKTEINVCNFVKFNAKSLNDPSE